MTKAPQAQRPRGRRTQETVLDTAERLFAAQGYAATSMAEIIEASGVASSSIYYHFDSKSGVFVAVLQRGAAEFIGAARAARAQDSLMPPKARLRVVVTESTKAMVDYPRFLRLYYGSIKGMEGDEAARDAMLKLRRVGVEALTANLEEAFEAWGHVRAKAAAARVVAIALPLFDGMFLAHLAGEIPDVEHFAAEATEALYPLAESTPAPGRDEPGGS